MFNFWKPRLTDYFIAQIKQQGGLLINLASSEMKDLVDWGKVTREVKVITPEFQVYKTESRQLSSSIPRCAGEK